MWRMGRGEEGKRGIERGSKRRKEGEKWEEKGGRKLGGIAQGNEGGRGSEIGGEKETVKGRIHRVNAVWMGEEEEMG